jgi:hypothetical protein
MQNETIWLQHAQKEIENVLHATKLKEIGEWASKQKELYSRYFDELMQVKSLIAQAGAVKDIVRLQGRIVSGYKHAYALLSSDKNFTSEEISWMHTVYAGMLEESLSHLGRIKIFITGGLLQMNDAARMRAVEGVRNDMEDLLNDLQTFSQQQRAVSLRRGQEINSIHQTKKIYGTWEK